MFDAPCLGCSARQPGCHGSCQRYRDWKERNDGRRTHWQNQDAPLAVLATRARRNEKHRQTVAGRGMIHH